MSLHPRRAWSSRSHAAARLRRQWGSVVWLALVWCLLWGAFSVANVLGGLVLGALVVVVLPLPDLDFHGRVRPLAVLAVLGSFLVDLVVASFQVALLALSPRTMPRGAVVGVRLRNPSDLYLTVTAELASLVPGSLVVEVHRLTGMIYLHVLDLEAYGGVDKVRDDLLTLEARVLRALASDEELAAVGLARRRGRGGAA
ncbi:Na+/H+ antiporter subunit E [Luteimicrobium subarcticum]|uniref:Multisubunit sodium/proton antiporter MrpE subunit n=1 Tax=Luteimicrobium subarcticum TaxID=620910 RepID=A0A2M8WS18_9MICO|nr:Na+/H+ antiporter subunit E [Luteimicrobium subarcticum]PJI93742.1 multisubunit sodium/proton antiporter MrpE subunit [Luteimicrobium subarcticum]